MRLIIIFLTFFLSWTISPKAPEEPGKIEPLKIGNLALPGSQQPSPLFSFGQLVVEKGDTIGFTYFNFLKGTDLNKKEIVLVGLRGITDTWSASIVIPTSLGFRESGFTSTGIGDIGLFTEYAYYDNPTKTANNFATVVGGLFFPSGSPNKTPPTGTGAISLFGGLTFVHLAIDWYYFTSHGIFVSNKKNGNKIGDQYFYQFGLGHNIKSPPGWVFLGLVELFGTYAGQAIVGNQRICNSESNILFLAPSIYMASNRFTFQTGIACKLTQHLAVGQNPTSYIFVLGVAWKFDGPAIK